MIVYQPASVYLDQHHLKPFTNQVSKHLFPKGKVLSSSIDVLGGHVLVQSGKELIALELYPKELRKEAFETILQVAAMLEAKRKEYTDGSISEIGVCLLAHGFSEELLLRIPFGVPKIRLFEWRLIRSEKDKGILLRELKNGFRPEKTLTEKNAMLKIESSQEKNLSSENFSTPELIAFARFGMELRERRTSI